LAILKANAERVVWGSDWPHVNYYDQAPDDAVLLAQFGRWLPHEAHRRRVLVDNPAKLYGF
jgi:2-pyrone-4,6-dicarboxylate lactonase